MNAQMASSVRRPALKGLSRYVGRFLGVSLFFSVLMYSGLHVFPDLFAANAKAFPYIFLFLFPILVSRGSMAGFVAGALLLGAIGALDFANDFKVQVTGAPISTIDIALTANYPAGLLRSLGFGYSQITIMSTLGSLAVLSLLFLVAKLFSSRFLVRILFYVMTSGMCLAGLFVFASDSVTDQIYDLINDEKTSERYPVWSPEGHANLAQDLGGLSYLVYFSHAISSEKPYAFSDEARSPDAVSHEDSEQAYQGFFPGGGPISSEYPDIYIVHLESTFDPSEVFLTEGRSTNSLYPSSHLKVVDSVYQWEAPALVNTVGGNSWVSEFEVLTGFDTRIFGLLGRYSHSTLSHLFRNAFPAYLKERGYSAAVFTETSPEFFNYGNAYRNYGFDAFFGYEQLKVSSDDAGQVKRVLELLPVSSSNPNFSMILLSENHSPHLCDTSQIYSWEIDFDGDVSDDARCMLQEYDRRATHTEQAVKILLSELERRREITNREFIVLTYGDHQPFTFTGGGGPLYDSGIDFSSVRQDASMRRTFAQIFTSFPSGIRCCGDGPIPLTLLPSLVSALIDPASPYLPSSFYQQEVCGGDFIGELVIENAFYASSSGERSHEPSCSQFGAIVSSLLHSGIMTNPLGFGKGH